LEVLIEAIRPSPFQPRITFEIGELKREIETNGLLSPLIVREINGHYELIDGERRFRALNELGWKKVPVEVKQMDDRLAKLSIWKLNTIRETYNVEDRARYFKKLADGGMTAYQIGLDLSIDDQWVRTHLNVFKFPIEIQAAVWSGALPLSTIRELDPIINANMNEAVKLANESLNRRLDKREVREIVTDKYSEQIEQARMVAAKEALGGGAPIKLNLEEPRELERAAKALLSEAKKKRQQSLTPQERGIQERNLQDRRLGAEKARQKLEQRVRSEVEQEFKFQKASELLKEPEVVRELIKSPEVRQMIEEEKQPQKTLEQKEFPKHWADELAQDPAEVQEGNRVRWNLERIENAVHVLANPPSFYTTSYSGRDIPTFVEIMKAAQVGIVYDIRDTPYSQFRPDFNKDALAKALKVAGIDYLHVPELGVRREVRDQLAKTGDYDAFWKLYDEGLEDKRVVDLLEDISKRLEQREGEPFALLCMERDPRKCHRHRLALHLQEDWAMGSLDL
jgi:ParB family chromosome partitioning protein